MSYDIDLNDPETSEPFVLDVPLDVVGGTVEFGGTTSTSFNITYNYSKILYKVMDGGIRSLYGKTSAETIDVLERAINQLDKSTATDNYWEATEGNVAVQLEQILFVSRQFPHGVWNGD